MPHNSLHTPSPSSITTPPTSSPMLCLTPLSSRTLHTTPMACSNICRPCGPTPLANSCNEPCALQCQDSRVIIDPSPVLVTLPGPIMTSFPRTPPSDPPPRLLWALNSVPRDSPSRVDLVALATVLAMAVDLAMAWEAWAATAGGAATSAEGPQHHC
ncbi:hypothetical protein DUI87_06814 [Hirundo rustica rustica]|uniref:Keratin n=1 Tax=Hirundo rustica rustica TaxID=333673 RepID=A0A3M0KN35_HIRRU|nr:hypothetical protein DUI87_06814 [Hirundo rustica rustica]